LPVVQDLDLLLSGQIGMVNHRIGALEQVGRIVQSPLQIDFAHCDLRIQAERTAAPDEAGMPAL
jgi:hypothetical protein